MASIDAKKLSIHIPVFTNHHTSIKKKILRFLGYGVENSGVYTVNALNDFSISLKDGARLGLYGPNGCGKSTLLRALAGVYDPSAGDLFVNGKVASLIDILGGFDHEASGIENIYIKCLLMGLDKSEIDLIKPSIIEFAELGEFINLPIRTYSSGMLMRLGFSIVTAVKADIILMDEWLSVGDEKFIKKAEDRLQKYISQSSIFVIASHNMKLLKSLCTEIYRF